MVFPGKDWQRQSPESMGIDSRAIDNALRAIEASGKDLHSMLIVRSGVLVYEHYFVPYTKDIAHSMYSCSKTFTSMLIGIARGKGLLTLDDKVLSWFPDTPVEKPNDNLRQMTIRDLLMMGSGHGEDTFGNMTRAADGDWAKVFLNQIVDHKPGTHFVYNTGATYMLSAILTRATGKTALELANEWIFSKIGIEGATWDACPRGISMGGTGLHIKPTDMARFGLLISNEGVWNGERVIPADYILDAQTKHIDNRNPNDPKQDPNWAAGYCYQMWRCKFPAFRADGMGGQFIAMMPDREALFVFTSALGEDIGYPLNVIEDYLLPGLHDAALPENADAAKELAEHSARLAKPVPGERPACAWNFAMTCDENEMGIRKISFDEKALTLAFDDAEAALPYAWNAPVVTETDVSRAALHRVAGEAPVAVMAYCRDGMHVRVQVVGTPFTFTLTPAEAGDRLTLDVYATIGGSCTLHGTRA